MINDRIKILKQYVKNSIIIDIVSLLPFFIKIFASYVAYDISKNHTLRFFQLLFLLKIINFQKIVQRLEERRMLSWKFKKIIELLKLIFTILFIAHIIACVWLTVAVLQNENGLYSWLEKYNLEFNYVYVCYINSFYFAIVTMYY